MNETTIKLIKKANKLNLSVKIHLAQIEKQKKAAYRPLLLKIRELPHI
jgi:hypothetical protein